jgi:methylated-DNA-protein-cysteine methyltransferase related protein
MRRRTYDRIVWEIVWQIPAGRVMTYGQIASMIPAPSGMDVPAYERIAPRWVGYAMRRCMTDANNQPPDATHPGIPWQRVINSQGQISLPVGSAEAAQQRIRLEAEGVVFDRSGRVDLRRFGWPGPDADWLAARGLLPPYTFE